VIARLRRAVYEVSTVLALLLFMLLLQQVLKELRPQQQKRAVSLASGLND